jgi:erythronate-4-phosphate dehydrogenase
LGGGSYFLGYIFPLGVAVKIIADKDIPFVEHYFGSAGDLVLIEGRALQRKLLLDADILLVRSITPVNEKLLAGTNVKFVASPTTGMDHFDTEWLHQAGIHSVHAPGCNAIAVEEYIVCVIAALQKQGYLIDNRLRAGVIGVGNIGHRVVNALKILGFEVFQCDPLRAELESDFVHHPLETLHDLDFVTLHTPLTHKGLYPTYHMIDKHFFERQKKNTVLMNSGRGAVIHFNDLKLFGQPLLWSLDVWEHEPYIDYDVLDRAIIATPHIAGYTVQSKYRGIEMIYQALIQHGAITDRNIHALKPPTQKLFFDNKTVDWRDIVLKIYNPMLTTALMKQKIIENDNTFDVLRKNFVERFEFFSVACEDITLNNHDRSIWESLQRIR